MHLIRGFGLALCTLNISPYSQSVLMSCPVDGDIYSKSLQFYVEEPSEIVHV